MAALVNLFYDERKKEMKKQDIKNLIEKIKKEKTRSAWSKGVKDYALELAESLYESDFEKICNIRLLKKALLNGADSWLQYSEGGCSLIYDSDIAKRLCNKSELKRFNGGLNSPKNKTWIIIQARALNQAEDLVLKNACFD